MMEAELKNLLEDIINNYTRGINDLTVRDIVYKLIERMYNKGLLEGEITFNMNFVPNQQSIFFLQNFAFDNVKKLNSDLKDLLRKEISLALMNRESASQIRARVRDIMNTTIDRAKLITITEENRAFNIGHYEAAKQSGLNVVKEWSAQPERNENNPCPICEAMDGVQVPMDAKFHFKDGDSVLLAPKHPRCKCRILYVQIEKAKIKGETTFQGHPGKWRTVMGRKIFFTDDGQALGENGKAFEFQSLREQQITNKKKYNKEIAGAYTKVPKETLKKLKENSKLYDEGKDTQGIHSKNGVYSDDRVKNVHMEIISKFHELIIKTKSDKPKVVFMAGVPASGKTYATRELFDYDESFIGTHKETGEKYVILNPDNFKTMLPEYDKGIGATLVHEESSHLNKMLVDLAIKHKANIIIDATMGNFEKAEKLLSRFHNEKYASTLIHVERDIKDAIQAALERFEHTGRFVYFENIPLTEPGVIDAVNKLKKVFHNFTRIENVRKK